MYSTATPANTIGQHMVFGTGHGMGQTVQAKLGKTGKKFCFMLTTKQLETSNQKPPPGFSSTATINCKPKKYW
jgi:hypothetical protein